MHTPFTNNFTKLPASFRAKAAAILQSCFGSNGVNSRPQGELIPQTQEQLTQHVESDWAAAEAKAKSSGGKLPREYTLAGVPLPPWTVRCNIMVMGGMGSGKTVAILDLADQVAAAGKTMIVYDLVQEYVTHYYRDDTDVIFNPFDSRFPGWNLFAEISQDYECDQLAYYLFPSGEDAGATVAYLNGLLRTVFACILKKLRNEGRGTNEELCKAIFETSQEVLQNWLKGTPAEGLLNPEDKGSGGGAILTSMQQKLMVLRYVPSGDFSLKEFIRQAGDRRIFLTSKADMHALLKPLIALALDVLYTAVLADEQLCEDKYWFLLDELKSIGYLPDFEDAVTESLRFGAVTVVGVQSTAQVDEMFGKEEARTIFSNLRSQLILRSSEEITLPYYADRASELKMLPDCAGYLQIEGNYDVARVDYKPRYDRPVISVGWLPRSDVPL